MTSNAREALFFVAAACYCLSLVLFAGKRDRLSFQALVAGFVVHTVYQVSRGWISGIFLPQPIFGSIFFLPWALALVTIVRRARATQPAELSQSLVVLVVLFTMFAAFFPKGMGFVGPNKLTAWAWIYFCVDVMARACFYCGSWLAVLFLLKKTESDGYHGLIVWGFLLFSVAQVVGAVWCFLGWGATFQWVYVHFNAAAVWCFYANYLHLRYLPTWDPRARARYAVAGFFLMFGHYLIEFIRYCAVPQIGG